MRIYIDAVGIELSAKLQEQTSRRLWTAIAPFASLVSWTRVQFLQDWTPDGRGGVFCHITVWTSPQGILDIVQYADDVSSALDLGAARIEAKLQFAAALGQRSRAGERDAEEDPIPSEAESEVASVATAYVQ